MQRVSFFNRNEYKKYIIGELQKDQETTTVINTLLFANGKSILDFLNCTHFEPDTGVRLSDFEKLRSFGRPFGNREDLDSLPLLQTGPFPRYEFFKQKEFNTYQQAVEAFPPTYHWTKVDCWDVFDSLIIDRLGGYKKNKKKAFLYEKTLEGGVIIKLSTFTEMPKAHRELCFYKFPRIILNNGINDYDTNMRVDIFRLILTAQDSFLFFNKDLSDYSKEKSENLIAQKTDEPVIYEDENGGFLITNSWENIERYNKYIAIILDLTTHFYKLFEKWVIDNIKVER
ncbi:hypothetical protein ACFS6H_04790 [Terrimonas rubra]|uniref:Uncharacterized protein n=1 Tax=Terrimonas rubra TaxID=1035890 RepID=A0ABW6A155_9BACT